MKKNKTDIKKTDSSVEAPGSQSKEDEINGFVMLFLLHLIFTKWAVYSIPSYKKNHAGSEPAIINFSYADDKNSSADERTYYNTIALLQEKYCKGNGQDDDAELNNPFVFLSKECSDYLLNKRTNSEKQVTLELEDLADGVIYYPYLPRISIKSSNSGTIFSKKTSYGRYTAEILTALTGIFYTTQNNEYKGKIIECDAALTALLADYLKPSTKFREFGDFLKNTNSYTEPEKDTILDILNNLRLSNFYTNPSLLSFYYNNPCSIIDQLIFTVRRAWSKEISIQIDNDKDKNITMSLFTCLEKVDELLNKLTLISSRKNTTKDLEETKQLENDEYLIFTRDIPDTRIKYNQITGITIATYKISKYLNDLIRSGSFPSVNLYDWQCGYHKYWLSKIISQFMLIIYVEKKQFLNMSQYNNLKRKELDGSVPEVFFKYINDEGEKKDKEVPQFRHPFIANGNSNADNHQKNCESRAKFDNVMDDVLDKYNPIFYEVTIRVFKRGIDVSHIATEEYITDQAADIAKNITKTKIFDKEKYRKFYKNYFLKFNNIFNALSSIDKRDTLYPEAQKIKIREALDSQDKPRGRKALWDLIGLYGRYINNNCRSCRYYNTYASELDDSKSKATNENPANICREWEYNPVGCNHECNTGKILSEIESALYDIYSMFDFPDDNGALR